MFDLILVSSRPSRNLISQSGPQGRTLRPDPGGPIAAGRAKGSGLSFFSEDSHNVILDALGVNDASGE